MRFLVVLIGIFSLSLSSASADTLYAESEEKFPISKFLTGYFQQKLAQGQFISGAKVSKNGEVAALLVYEYSNGGSNYSAVYIAHTDKDESKIVSEFVYLPAKDLAAERGEPFVSKLGGISDDGAKILLNIGTQSAPVAPYNVTYGWQIREIKSGRTLESNVSEDQAKKYGIQYNLK